jgi:hypothetical protein
MRYDRFMNKLKVFASVLLVIVSAGCSTGAPAADQNPFQVQVPAQEDPPMTDTVLAEVLEVKTTGAPNAYQFEVKVSSPDTGCDQYADWWEVLSEDGDLLYRRVLLHSHVNEQPFTRSGGPVPIDENTVRVVRAHMKNGGYGGHAMTSVETGFEPIQLEMIFASDVRGGVASAVA